MNSLLLPYQQRWIADPSPVKVCEKSRQIGMSWTEAADCALKAAAAGGQDSWIVSINEDSAREFIGDVTTWANVYQLAASQMEQVAIADVSKDILSFRITFASGKRVTALSSRPTNLRGKRGKVVIDEFAFHDNPDELLKAALALLMWGGQVSILSTHNGVESEFNQLINDVRTGKRPYNLHRITIDDALSEGLYSRIALKLGLPDSPEAEVKWREDLFARYGSDAEEELLCIPSRSGGIYLSRSLVEACMSQDYPVLRLALPDGFVHQSDTYRRNFIEGWCRDYLEPLLANLPAGAKTYFGQDFGRSGDLSVIAPLVELSNLKRYSPFTIELRNVPFESQKQLLLYLLKGLDRKTRLSGGAMDKTGSGAYLAEVVSQQYRIVEQVAMSQNWHLEAWPKYKAALEDGNFSIPWDLDILDDHRLVRMVNGVPKIPEGSRFKGKDGGQRHGDSAIAYCLAWHAASKGRLGWQTYQRLPVQKQPNPYSSGIWGVDRDRIPNFRG